MDLIADVFVIVIRLAVFVAIVAACVCFTVAMVVVTHQLLTVGIISSCAR